MSLPLYVKLQNANILALYHSSVTFELDCIEEDPFADMASLEYELESTDRLSQNALSLSGLSIRFPFIDFPPAVDG